MEEKITVGPVQITKIREELAEITGENKDKGNK